MRLQRKAIWLRTVQHWMIEEDGVLFEFEKEWNHLGKQQFLKND